MGDAHVRLVAGRAGGRTGPVEGIAVAPQLLDVALPGGGRAEIPIPAAHNAFAYVIQGVALLGGARSTVSAGQIAVLGAGDMATVATDHGARLLLVSGQPIGEPVKRRGPFVMNTEEELDQAKNKVCAQIVLHSERPTNRLFSVGNAWIQRRQYKTVREAVNAYRGVTLDDIARVLKKYPLNRTATVAVGPSDSSMREA